MHRKAVVINLLIVVTFVAEGLRPREIQAALAHRYSFTTNASDSVGTAHGIVVDPGVPTAVFAGGKLDLSANIGQSSQFITEDAYVDLPNGLINDVAIGGTSGAFSIEFWAAVSATQTWQRFVDFGTSDCGEGQSCVSPNSSYIYITPNSGALGQGLAAEVHAANGASDVIGQSGTFPNGPEAHIVATYNQQDTSAGANGTFKLFRNGSLLGAHALPASFNLNTYTNNNNWLGRSQWNDPVFDGSFNEMRLYDHALTGLEVTANTLLGPDRLSSPVAYEGFDYSPPGADLVGSAGGYGFSGPWGSASATANYDVGAGSLAYPRLATNGNRVTTAANNSGIGSIGRTLSTPLGQAGTTQYVSVIVRPEGTLNEGQFNGFFGIRLETASSIDLFVGKSGGGATNQIVLENAGGTLQHASGTTAEIGKEYLLVLRADFTSGNDVFTLYVNPTPGAAEPVSGTVKNDVNIGIINQLFLYATGAFSIDEIRIGPSFADVVPPLPGDYNLNGTVDAADYVVWRKNVGTTNMLPNDLLGGTIDADQYNQWRSFFGETTPGSGAGASISTAVPESSTWALLISAVICICAQTRLSSE